jgi:hypothetical protein
VSLPSPRRGLVVRHAFVWSHEKAAGTDEARKDRPCVIVLMMASDESGQVRGGVVPITHRPPTDPDGGIEVPTSVRRQLGLDDARQWVIYDELNRFVWPGYDLRPVPGQAGSYAYGMLPQDLYDRIVRGVLARNRARKLSVLDRD